MSAKSQIESGIIGAHSLKLWKFYYFSTILLVIFISQCVHHLCCSFQQRKSLPFSSNSMRLRPKRTCSGVECFGGFHIKRFIDLFLFSEGRLHHNSQNFV